MLKLHEVGYRYAGATSDSLHGISFELNAGSVTGLVGAAEAGKSTLCLVLGGLAPRVIRGDFRGSMAIDGEDVTGWPLHRITQQVVVGLQDPAGQLSMVAETVYEEVAFGVANLGPSRDEVMDRVESALRLLGLGELASRDPRGLSGGQQQLVVLAGLLAMRPRHLILDEPLAHLDARSTELLMAAIADVAAAGTAVLMAEQRTEVLADHAESIVVIAGGDLVRVGPTVDVLADPAVLALGVAEPPGMRLGRLLAGAGMRLPGTEGAR